MVLLYRSTAQPAPVSARDRLLLWASSPREKGRGLWRICSEFVARCRSIRMKYVIVAPCLQLILAVGIFHVNFKNQSAFTTACWFQIVVLGSGSKMSMATNARGRVAGTNEGFHLCVTWNPFCGQEPHWPTSMYTSFAVCCNESVIKLCCTYVSPWDVLLGWSSGIGIAWGLGMWWRKPFERCHRMGQSLWGYHPGCRSSMWCGIRISACAAWHSLYAPWFITNSSKVVASSVAIWRAFYCMITATSVKANSSSWRVISQLSNAQYSSA